MSEPTYRSPAHRAAGWDEERIRLADFDPRVEAEYITFVDGLEGGATFEEWERARDLALACPVDEAELDFAITDPDPFDPPF